MSDVPVKGRFYVVTGNRHRPDSLMDYHSFKKGSVVQCVELEDSLDDDPVCCFTNGTYAQKILICDVREATTEEITEAWSTGNLAATKPAHLPKWTDMLPQDRHQLLGELIDAMIYDGRAVMEVQRMVSQFRTAGYVRNVILPADTHQHCDHLFHSVQVIPGRDGESRAVCSKCGFQP